MNIRRATIGDCATVASIHARSWQSAYRGILTDHYLDNEIEKERLDLWRERFGSLDEKQVVLCAEGDNGVVGFLCAYLDQDVTLGSFVDNLHVLHGSKRSGIGSDLMRAIRDISIREYSVDKLYLWVLAMNAPAIHFYESIGGLRKDQGYWNPPDGGEYLKFLYCWG